MSPENPRRDRLLLISESNTEISSTYQAMDVSLPTITGTISTDPLRGGLLSYEIHRGLQQLFQESDKFLKEDRKAPDRNPNYVDTCLDYVNRALSEQHQLILRRGAFYTLNAKGFPDTSRSVTGEKSPLSILRRLQR